MMTEPQNHEMAILSQVARLFRAFPAGKNVDEHTLQDYCEAFSDFDIQIVAHVVDRFRLGKVKRQAPSFPPALAEIMIHMRNRHAFIRLQNERAELGTIGEPKTNRYLLPKTHFLNRYQTPSNVARAGAAISQDFDHHKIPSNVARAGTAISQDFDHHKIPSNVARAGAAIAQDFDHQKEENS
jgi:hypothetical protein